MENRQSEQQDNTARAQLLSDCLSAGFAGIAILQPHLSDYHNGGRCAALFEHKNQKYIYKPRSPRADFAWAAFLEELSGYMSCPMPRAVVPLNAEEADFTIVPFVAGREARDTGQVRAYYRRCGALLALCTVLGSYDLHMENVLADGDSPVLVDVETLLAGVTPDQAGRQAGLCETLMGSHLLPNWMQTETGENVDVGAMTARGKNAPRLDGAYCPAYDYAEEICQGLDETLREIIAHRTQVAEALRHFAKAPIRKLLRPTAVYDKLVRQIASLTTAEEREIAAGRLRRAYTLGDPAWAKRMQRTCESEMQSVLRGDIPYFFAYGDETALRDVCGVAAEGYFALSPLAAALARLETLDVQAAKSLSRFVRQSLRAVCPNITGLTLNTAEQVFEWFEGRAIAGLPSAFADVTTDARGRAYFQSVGFDLYDGLLGILCFYAAYYEATGDARARVALLGYYAAYRRAYIENRRPLRANDSNISLTNGVGGHIVALGYIARCLREKDFLTDAACLLRRFDFSHLPQELCCDVYAGAAGLLMALPLLLGCGMDDEIARIAQVLSARLLSCNTGLTGFGHGEAGMALALSAAQKVGGGDHTREILRRLEWENALYDETACNWPDLRSRERRGYMHGLCAGAPGIGIARKQMLQYVTDARIQAICREDVARVQFYLKSRNESLRRDSLCCGNAAQMAAERILTGATERAALQPQIEISRPLDTDTLRPGLFQGIAGVGYALARSLPTSRSSLLVWEAET